MMRYPVDPKALTAAHEWIPLNSHEQGTVDLADVVGLETDHVWRKAYARADDPDYTDNPCTLGLHWTRDKIRPSHFIGAVNLPFGDGQYPLVVRPRAVLEQQAQIDYGTMFASVLATPVSVTGMELDWLFGCDPDTETIQAACLPQLTLLEVTAFLATTARFVQRHLRHGFVQVHENLVGRARGRILVPAQIRQNLVHARSDRMVCVYQQFNLDTLENRLLKAALDVCTHWIATAGHIPPPLQHWVWTIRAALATVPPYRPHPRDWSRIRNKGLMAAYAQPLALARLVLTRLHLKPDGQSAESDQTLPFFLDANRLFEGWVGVCLSYVCDSVRGQLWKSLNFCGRPYFFRPDFLVEQENGQQIIVDSKYKPFDNEDKRRGPEVQDLYQVIGYARLLADPAPVNGDCSQGMTGLHEACLAIPGGLTPNVQDALSQFSEAWHQRFENGRCWKDGFRLTMVKVPLPQI